MLRILFENNDMTDIKPFIKVTWEDTPENFTHEKQRRIKEYFSKKYSGLKVKVVTSSVLYSGGDKGSLIKFSDENITNNEYQKKLIKKFIEQEKIEIDWDSLNRLDDKVNNERSTKKSDSIKHTKWSIQSIRFSNFLSYGDENVIDFTTFNGITIIESDPPNFGGKTTISVDLLMFLFFGSTTKTQTNAQIFNTFREDENEVYVKGTILIDNERYVIERKLTRKKTKKGEFNIENKLTFYTLDSNNNRLNLNDEQASKTKKKIEEAIGSEEDFLLTILTTGSNLEDLIRSKPTARGMILTKFLGLEILKEKEEICKNFYNEYQKKLLSNTHNIVELENKNKEYADRLISIEDDVKTIKASKKQINDDIDVTEKRIDSYQSQTVKVDEELLKINEDVIKKSILTLQNEIVAHNAYIKQINLVEPFFYYDENEFLKLEKRFNELKNDVFFKERECVTKNNAITNLVNGGVCQTCNQKIAHIDHTEQIKKLRGELEELKKLHQIQLNDLNQTKIEYEKIKNNKEVYFKYETDKLKVGRAELEIDNKTNQIKALNDKLTQYRESKDIVENNKQLEIQIITEKSKLQTLRSKLLENELSVQKMETEKVTITENIDINNNLIKKIHVEQKFIKTFQVYLSIFGKNGLGKMIFRDMIPVLNYELNKILDDSCEFTVQMNVNDKNEIEFLMIDYESRITKPLFSGSGYERTIASLALRAVLTKASVLPKPNIIVMDEVFGMIAESNLPKIGNFFQRIKNYFENIFIISHIPVIRNWADNLIMVRKEENISLIDNIKTNIS